MSQFILRVIAGNPGIPSNSIIGESYSVIVKENNPEYFNTLCEGYPEYYREAHSVVQNGFGEKRTFLQYGWKAYVMTESGSTFENVSPPPPPIQQFATMSIGPTESNFSHISQYAADMLDSSELDDNLEIKGRTSLMTDFCKEARKSHLYGTCLFFSVDGKTVISRGYLINKNDQFVKSGISIYDDGDCPVVSATAPHSRFKILHPNGDIRAIGIAIHKDDIK
jgi:hypothetical protein